MACAASDCFFAGLCVDATLFLEFCADINPWKQQVSTASEYSTCMQPPISYKAAFTPTLVTISTQNGGAG